MLWLMRLNGTDRLSWRGYRYESLWGQWLMVADVDGDGDGETEGRWTGYVEENL
jgi:hypothetical protein